MTTRREIEGTLARWFAVDADTHIGVFTGPYAAWPATVFDDYPTVAAADDLVACALPTCGVVLSEYWRRSAKDPTHPELEASRGLYSFDADPGYGGQSVYLLDASPVQPLLEREAPAILQAAARLVRLATIRFAVVTEIDLARLVPIVVGRG